MRGKVFALLAGLALAGLALAGCQVILGIQDPEPPAADAGPDALVCPDPCDLVSNCGCAGGTCSWDVPNTKAYCRTQSGGADVQQSCVGDADCIQGLACVFGTCRSYCNSDDDCPFRTFCTADFTPDFPVKTCSDRCDASNNLGCPSGGTCIPIQGTDSAACAPAGTIATGSECASDVFGCVVHDVCYQETSGLLDCRQVCSISAGGTDCPTGHTCDNHGDLAEDGQPVGLCSL